MDIPHKFHIFIALSTYPLNVSSVSIAYLLQLFKKSNSDIGYGAIIYNVSPVNELVKLNLCKDVSFFNNWLLFVF